MEKLKWNELDLEVLVVYACTHGLACMNGQLGRSSQAGLVSLWRDMPSDSLHLCLSLCDSSTLPSLSLSHTHTRTLMHAHTHAHTDTFSLSFPLWLQSNPPYSWVSSTGQAGLKRFSLLLMMLISFCDISHTFSFPRMILKLSYGLK